MLLTFSEEVAEEKKGECEPVKIGEGLWQAFVVARQSAEARSPAKGALNDPTPREQHETALGRRKLDHIERCV